MSRQRKQGVSPKRVTHRPHKTAKRRATKMAMLAARAQKKS